MIDPKYLPLVVKQIVRRRTRTLLTVLGVATAMFLFAVVQAMQAGVREATEATAKDTTLVVYRQNRFCPATSRLPEHYAERIAKLPGVVNVVPMKIAVTNCRTALDVITFRGVPADDFVAHYAPSLEIVSGSLQAWEARTDAALVGETLAARRGFSVGDQFDAAGIRVVVAGIIRSEEPQDMNVAYVHLPFLQRGTGNRQLGVVTQFNVKTEDPGQLEAVARQIDEAFARDQEPTHTSSEKSFVARAASDVVEIVGFTGYLAWGCLAAVLALVGNAIVLSVQDRIREHAVLQTLGFRGSLIGRLVIAEGMLLAMLGGVLGTALALAALHWGNFSLSAEGLSIHFAATPEVLLVGLAASAALGVAAGLVPAIQASRRPIVSCFRAV